MANILQLTNADVINCQWKSDGSYWLLRPLELTTQRGWAVGLAAKTDPKYADIAAILNAGTTLAVTPSSDYVSLVGTTYRVKVDSKIMTFACDKRYARSIQAPASNRIVFNILSGDQGLSSDPALDRHRTELSGSSQSFALGADTWYSCSFRINDMGVLDCSGAFAICWQWHGNDSKVPPVSINFKDGKIGVWTTSSDALDGGGDGVIQEKYRAAAKMTTGVYHTIVLRVKTGTTAAAILQLYIDGSLIKDYGPAGADGTIAVGYHATGGFTTYPNIGIYCADKNHPDVIAAGAAAQDAVEAAVTEVEYANVEYGTSSLFARVASPLPI